MHKLQAITQLRPGTHWNERGDVVEQCEGEPKVSIPSDDEIQAILDSVAYIDQRRPAYPPLTDLADALVHQANGNAAPLAKYISDCNTIKSKFPKPE